MAANLTSALAVTALVVAALALALATLANRRWARHPRQPVAAAPSAEAGQEHTEPHPGSNARSEGAVAALTDQVAALSSVVADLGAATALRHVAMVRYDAYADVGGRLSYSVAVLDDTVSGLVLTTLSGKSDVRTYVRMISAGAADGSLTAEEHQAIEAAIGSEQ